MKSIISSSLLLGLAAAHGVITTPPTRQAGDAYKAACGEQVFNNQKSDSGGPVELIQNVGKGQKDFDPATCNVFLCKGFVFDDNAANVQTYMPGQTVMLKADIKAPHTGTCNVSIVDTKANAMIGAPLKVFDEYASTSRPIPDDNRQFTITMPMDLGGKCAAAGDCVVQWFWAGEQQGQTYEACVDFTMGGAAAAAPAPAAKEKRQIMEPVAKPPPVAMKAGGMSDMPGMSMEEMPGMTMSMPPTSMPTGSTSMPQMPDMPGMDMGGMNMNAAGERLSGLWMAAGLTAVAAAALL